MAEDMENIAELLRKEKVRNIILKSLSSAGIKLRKFNLVPAVHLRYMLDHKAEIGTLVHFAQICQRSGQIRYHFRM